MMDGPAPPSPIDAGRDAVASRRRRDDNPYGLDAPTRSERSRALAWARAWSDANPMPFWDDDADPDVDPPLLGPGSTGWRRARMYEEYVRKRYGPDIQVSAGHDEVGVGSFVIGRGNHLVFLERVGPAGWRLTEDPDVARRIPDDQDATAASTTVAIARAVDLLGAH